jgi:hypothetical protein
MYFMNCWDISEAEGRFKTHPVLGPATRFLREFAEEVNANSDGWAYWGPPVHAAEKLMRIVNGHMMAGMGAYPRLPEPTKAEILKALTPIKAFYTRYKNGQYGSGPKNMKLPTIDWAVQQRLV